MTVFISWHIFIGTFSKDYFAPTLIFIVAIGKRPKIPDAPQNYGPAPRFPINRLHVLKYNLHTLVDIF